MKISYIQQHMETGNATQISDMYASVQPVLCNSAVSWRLG